MNEQEANTVSICKRAGLRNLAGGLALVSSLFLAPGCDEGYDEQVDLDNAEDEEAFIAQAGPPGTGDDDGPYQMEAPCDEIRDYLRAATNHRGWYVQVNQPQHYRTYSPSAQLSLTHTCGEGYSNLEVSGWDGSMVHLDLDWSSLPEGNFYPGWDVEFVEEVRVPSGMTSTRNSWLYLFGALDTSITIRPNNQAAASLAYDNYNVHNMTPNWLAAANQLNFEARDSYATDFYLDMVNDFHDGFYEVSCGSDKSRWFLRIAALGAFRNRNEDLVPTGDNAALQDAQFTGDEYNYAIQYCP